MPIRFSQLLDPSRITLHVQSTRRLHALYEVARLLEGHPDVSDFDGFYEELLDRERLDTTCLGNGIALPHARTGYVNKIVLAVGRSDQGVVSEDGHEVVNLFFVLGTPRSKPGDYLQVVSSLCRILKHEENREILLHAATPDEFIAAVIAIEDKVLAPA